MIQEIPPSGPQSESITVSAGAATLSFVPDFSTVSIAGYVRIFEGTTELGQFKVTPGSAVLGFNTGNNGAELTVVYNVAAAAGVTVEKMNEVIDQVNVLSGDDPDTIIEAEGDLIVGDSDDKAARLPVGSNDDVLAVVGGIPTWTPLIATPNPMTNPGDIIVGGTAGTPEALAAGSEGQALVIVSGVPAYGASLQTVLTAAGSLVTSSGAATPSELAAGSEGEVLKIASGIPSWEPETGFANPMTAEGDLIVGGVDGAPEALPAGSNDQVLIIAAGVPTWSALIDTPNPMTTPGDIIVATTAGSPTALAAGSDGDVLTISPSTHLPVWSAPSAGGDVIRQYFAGAVADPEFVITPLDFRAILSGGDTGDIMIPVVGLKVGDTITAFNLLGVLRSSGDAVTINTAEMKLFSPSTGASLGSLAVPIVATSTTEIKSNNSTVTLGSPYVVNGTESIGVIINATAVGTADFELIGIQVAITE